VGFSGVLSVVNKHQVVLIDNYDSFTYNLVQLVGALGHDPVVLRNDVVSVPDVFRRKPSHIILSPGPGRPEAAGICVELIRQLPKKLPLLGVCLGHQALAVSCGARVSIASELVHGKSSIVNHFGHAIFRGIDEEFTAGRYHSLIVDRENLPADLEIIATGNSGEIMAMQWHQRPVFGVQFHPESILTPQGKTLLHNFLSMEPV
jgi:anthranilate synthase component 2